MSGKNSEMAIASFVLGLSGLFFVWVPGMGQVLLVLAIIFGFVGLSKIKKNPELGGKTLAIIGIVLGFLMFFISLVFLFVTFAWFAIGNNLDASSEFSESFGLKNPVEENRDKSITEIKNNFLCMDLGVNLIDIKELDSGTYEVTLKRTYTGDVFDGINLFFSKGNINLGGVSFSSLNPGEEKSEIVFVGLENAELEGYTIFHVDNSGVEVSCSEQIVKF